MTRLTHQQVADRALSEADLRSQANDVATMLGWTYVWVGPLRTSHGWETPTRGPLGKGWPDTIYLRPRDHRRLAVEFKSELAYPTPEQYAVLRVLESVGFAVMVCRPSAFDELVAALR